MLPNIVRGVHYRILNRTAAGNSINTLTLPAGVDKRPRHILIRHDGGTPEPSDNRASIARITFECRVGQYPDGTKLGWEDALSLALEIRQLWRPGEEVVDGWHGDVIVPAIPARGIAGETVHFSGASVNAEPFFIPDEVTGTPRYSLPILISYS